MTYKCLFQESIYLSSNFRVHPYVDCKCDLEGSIGNNCDYDGNCTCANGNVIGDKCNSCADGFYGFPQCTQGRQLCKIFYILKHALLLSRVGFVFGCSTLLKNIPKEIFIQR